MPFPLYFPFINILPFTLLAVNIALVSVFLINLVRNKLKFVCDELSSDWY